ncbi:MAG: hypothetical protein R3325_01395 [Thermoanaerobaculia bacterium]|nr:hypothetical protein [Thermoanaerobaculia bacterium]
MRLAPRALAFILTPLLAATAGPALASAVEVEARLLTRTPAGPTRIGGHGSIVLAEGELGVLDLAAGVISTTPPRCLVSAAGGTAAPPALTGAGYRWRLTVELLSARGDQLELAVVWRRAGTFPGGGDAATEEQLELRMRTGESRHLDYVEFEPIAGDGSCGFDALVLEIEPKVRLGHPAYAGRDLDVEVWFTRRSGERREKFSSYRLTAPQGEKIVLPIEPLDVELELGPGSPGRLRTGGRVLITGWRVGRDEVAIRLEAVIQHRFDPGGVKVSSGEGSKLYRAGLGETVEIQLPPLFATLIVETQSLGLAGAPAEGVQIDGEEARVDLRKLAGGGEYSLLLRVSDAG